MKKLKTLGVGIAVAAAVNAQEPSTTLFGMADVGPAYSFNNKAYLGNAIFYEAGVSHNFADSKSTVSASVKGLTDFESGKKLNPNFNLDINETLNLGEKSNLKGGLVIKGPGSDKKGVYPYTTIDRTLFSKNGLSISANAGCYVDGQSKKNKIVPLGKVMAFKQWNNGVYAVGGVGINPAFNYGITLDKSTFNVLGGVGYGFGKKINKRHSPEATRIK